MKYIKDTYLVKSAIFSKLRRILRASDNDEVDEFFSEDAAKNSIFHGALQA